MRLVLLLTLSLIVLSSGSVVFGDRLTQTPKVYKVAGRANPTATHVVEIAVKLKNLDILEQVLRNVSNPSHEDYGKHWSKEEIGRLIKNDEATQAILSYLEQEGFIVKERSLLDEFLVGEGRIGGWERLFSTSFFEYEGEVITTEATHNGQIQRNRLLHRATSYSLPAMLRPHIQGVFGVSDFPVLHSDSLLFPTSDTVPIHSSEESSMHTFSASMYRYSIISIPAVWYSQ